MRYVNNCTVNKSDDISLTSVAIENYYEAVTACIRFACAKSIPSRRCADPYTDYARRSSY